LSSPKVAHGRAIGLFMLPVCALAGYTGVFLALMTLKL